MPDIFHFLHALGIPFWPVLSNDLESLPFVQFPSHRESPQSLQPAFREADGADKVHGGVEQFTARAATADFRVDYECSKLGHAYAAAFAVDEDGAYYAGLGRVWSLKDGRPGVVDGLVEALDEGF